MTERKTRNNSGITESTKLGNEAVTATTYLLFIQQAEMSSLSRCAPADSGTDREEKEKRKGVKGTSLVSEKVPEGG